MPRERPHVTPAEQAVLQALWDEGPQPIRTLVGRLYADHGPARHATVQKLLERLETKGLVRRDRRPRAHVFRARVSRGDYLGARLRELARRLGGEPDTPLVPLVTELVRSRPLSAEELQELRALLDEAHDDVRDTDGEDAR